LSQQAGKKFLCVSRSLAPRGIAETASPICPQVFSSSVLFPAFMPHFMAIFSQRKWIGAFSIDVNLG
jgi:hypothetical protein